MSPGGGAADRAAAAAIAVALAVLLAVSLVWHPVPLYGVETDLLGDSVPAARALREGRITPDTFLFRGPGYPLLLAAAWGLAGDAFLGARLLNLAATAAAAAAAYLMLRGFLGPTVALASLLGLLVNPVFVRAAIEAGSDMPALALALTSTWLMLRGGGWRSMAVAGLLAGFACITRYNALFLVPAALIAVPAGRRDGRRLLVWAGACALPVVAWVAIHLAVTGELPRNQNFLNVAYEVYGRGIGWDRFWLEAGSPFGSFLDVARYDPAAFAGHVARNFATRWLSDAHLLMPAWIGALAVPGVLVTWWRRPGWPAVALHFVLAYLVLTLVFYTPRFFLYLLPFYLSGALGLLLRGHLAPAPVRLPGRRLRAAGAIAAALLLAASAGATVREARRMLRNPPLETRAAGALLRTVGQPGERVMARKPHVAYYAGMGYVPLSYDDALSDFLAAARSARADYLFVSAIETQLQPQLSVLGDPEVRLPGLLPLAHRVLDENRFFALYRIAANAAPAPVFEDSLLAAIRRFAARRPGQPWPQIYLGGHLVMTMRRYREALGPLAEAERIAPADPLVARFQAVAHGELGELDRAAAACERALRLTREGGWEHGYLGHLRLRQGRYAEARESLRRALQQEPANAQYLAEYLQACGQGGYWKDAAEVAERIVRTSPGDAQARLLGARAWIALGRPDRARALVELPGPATGPEAGALAALADSLRRGRASRGR